MSEYIYNDVQTVAYRSPVILMTSIPCPRGFVLHTNNFGIITLTGKVLRPCAQTSKYTVRYDANIAVPEGGTVGEIDLGITIGGEPIPTSLGAATPTVVDAYFHVSGEAVIPVPRTVDYTIAIENLSDIAASINVRNMHVSILGPN